LQRRGTHSSSEPERGTSDGRRYRYQAWYPGEPERGSSDGNRVDPEPVTGARS